MKHAALEKLYPEWVEHGFWDDKYYPRRIVCPLGYYDPKYYSMIMAATLEVQQLSPPEEKFVHMRLVEDGVPTYFLASDFLQAVLNTEPPKFEHGLADMKFPLRSMVLCIPDNVSRKVFGFAVPYISFAHGIIQRTGTDEKRDMFIFHTCVIPDDGKPIGYYGKVPKDDSVHRTICDQGFEDYTQAQEALEMTWAMTYNGYKGFKDVKRRMLHDEGVPIPTHEDDKIIPDKCYGLLYKLLAVWQTGYSRFVEHGQQTRKERRKNDKVIKSALWSPNIIGGSYAPKYDSQGGTHMSPRMHWRRGHIRQQRWGQGNLQVKSIWIEPVLVNAPEEKKVA